MTICQRNARPFLRSPFLPGALLRWLAWPRERYGDDWRASDAGDSLNETAGNPSRNELAYSDVAFEPPSAEWLAMMTAISLSSTLPLVYYGRCTRQSVVIGLLLIPVYSVATALGARYFAVGGQSHSRRTAIATLATVAIATFFVRYATTSKG